MSRRLYTWKIRNREIALGDRTLIMGVVNVTPDSFSDGGNYLDPDRAYARALEMEEQGADLIDIGAESTKPGAQAITASEELQRLVPVLKRLRDKLSIPISVDTYKAEVAERALELGAEIINDPSGFTFDPSLSKPIVEHNAGVIFNHMRGRPETWASLGPMPDVMGSIIKDLDASVNRARRAGVDRLRMVVDPGIGFGKRREQNSEILARLGEMTRLELPILVGPSRKSFLAQPGERETEFATAAAVTSAILAGAHMVRVHDVAAMKAAVGVADEIYQATKRLAEARSAEAADGPSRRSKTAHTPQVSATVPRPAVRPPFAAKPPAEHKPEPPESAAPPERPFRPPPPADGDRPIRQASASPRSPFRSSPSRGDAPRKEGSRPFAPRRDGPPQGEGSRPFTPRRDGPPREGSRPFTPRRDGPPREGSRPFTPRRDGPPREGSRRFTPRRDGPPREGSRPFTPRRDGPPREGSRPFTPRREGPPREGSRPFTPRRDGPPREGSRPSGPRRDGPPREGSRPFKPRPGGSRPQGSGPRGPGKGGSPRKFPPRPPRKD